MEFEEKVIQLIKESLYETTEEEMEEIENEEHTEVIFDVSLEGLAMHFDSLEEDELESYFEIRFNHYSEDRLYKTEVGYYIVSVF